MLVLATAVTALRNLALLAFTVELVIQAWRFLGVERERTVLEVTLATRLAPVASVARRVCPVRRSNTAERGASRLASVGTIYLFVPCETEPCSWRWKMM